MDHIHLSELMQYIAVVCSSITVMLHRNGMAPTSLCMRKHKSVASGCQALCSVFFDRKVPDGHIVRIDNAHILYIYKVTMYECMLCPMACFPNTSPSLSLVFALVAGLLQLLARWLVFQKMHCFCFRYSYSPSWLRVLRLS